MALWVLPVEELQSNRWYHLVGLAAEAGAVASGFVFESDPPPGLMGALVTAQAERGIAFDQPTFFVGARTARSLFEGAGVEDPFRDPRGRRPLPGVAIEIVAPTAVDTFPAPNVLAILEGRDPALRSGCVVVSAHFDALGIGEPNAEGDSVYNGADDNASGTAALLAIARAFGTLPTRPARSVVFAAVSGEEIGLQGSRYLVHHGPVPAESVVANLNLDTVGGNARDSITVLGQALSDLGAALHRTLRENPDLGLVALSESLSPDIDYLRFSDQLSYLEQGVPALFFFAGEQVNIHTPDDEVDAVNAEKVAKVARLAFLTALAVAEDPDEPAWTDDGKRRLLRLQRAAQ